MNADPRIVKECTIACCVPLGRTVECHNGRARTGVRRRDKRCYVTTVEGLTGLIVCSPPCTEGYETGRWLLLPEKESRGSRCRETPDRVDLEVVRS